MALPTSAAGEIPFYIAAQLASALGARALYRWFLGTAGKTIVVRSAPNHRQRTAGEWV